MGKWREREKKKMDRKDLSVLIRPPILINWDSIIMISFNLNSLLKALTPNTIILQVRTLVYEF